MSYRIGIVGATGAVGRELISLLHSSYLPLKEVVLLASPHSLGKKIRYKDKMLLVKETIPDSFEGLDYILFSAGFLISRNLCTEASNRGAVVIDNSSAFRRNTKVPLVVPEINACYLNRHKGIIANPNCSTVITLMALYPLHKAFGLRRFFTTTYQAVSGNGNNAVYEFKSQLLAWTKGEIMPIITLPNQIALNLIPQIGAISKCGYTIEEHKMINESRKILGLPTLHVSATCVRVPIFRVHSISVNAEFYSNIDITKASQVIKQFRGIEYHNSPMPITYTRKVSCGIGRLRLDLGLNNGLSLFVVGDQLWKGSACNAIQIVYTLFNVTQLTNCT